MERCEPLLLSMLSLTGQAKGAAALTGSVRKGQSSLVLEISRDLVKWGSRRIAVLLMPQVLAWSAAHLPTTHRTEGSDAATLH